MMLARFWPGPLDEEPTPGEILAVGLFALLGIVVLALLLRR